MFKKIKKILVCLMVSMLSFQTMNLDILATDSNTKSELNPGEITQNKSTKWVDYGKGIAEISFDVTGKKAEEPLDVAIVYDNSGSMQSSSKDGMTNENTYPYSRWNYASNAAKLLSTNLLKNKNNNIAFIPFSDVLIDGNSLHTGITDFFETHKLIVDENNQPYIAVMRAVNTMYGLVERANGSQEAWDAFYKECYDYLGITKEDLAEVDNTKNAVIPFTNDVASITSAIDSLYPSGAGETNYEVALRKAQEYFKTSNNRKVILMISDGKPNRGGDSTVVANELKNSGVTIYTVGTGISDEDAGTLKAIASNDCGIPLYTSTDPSELSTVLESLRKQFDIAASDGVIEDVINTDYFEYYTDETHVPTVNNVAIGTDDFIVSQDKSSITWKIGDIRETTKTLRFYIKVKNTELNDELFDKDDSLLNKEGNYSTNKSANLSYKDIHTGQIVDKGHEMQSPSLKVSTTSLNITYYLSDASGNYITDKGQSIVLKESSSAKKALHVEYGITPENKIEVDGETYYIYKEDNKTINKIFTENDLGKTSHVTFRYVKQLNVTFDTNGNGTLGSDITKKEFPVDHTTMTIPTLPNIQDIPNNMIFMGWNTEKNGSGSYFNSASQVKENMTVYAQWKEKAKYTVIFQDDQGNPLKSDTVHEGEDAIAPENPEKEGSTFVGWDIEFTNVTKNLIVTAQYDLNKYTVKFDGNHQDSGTMDNQPFAYNESKALFENKFKKEHYTFTGWLYNGKVYSDKEVVKNLISLADGEVTLVAQWKEDNKYRVSFSDGFGTLLSEDLVYEGFGANAPANPEREGYTFTGWDKDFTNVQTNMDVVAQFEAHKYTVKFDGNGQDGGVMDNQEYLYGQSQTLTKNTFTKENYTFAGWSYNGKLYNDEQEVKNLIAINGGEVTLVAQWVENNQFNVTFVDGFGNELKNQPVYEGQDATAPANPEREGYTFIGWDQAFTNVKSNITIIALWEREDAFNPDQPNIPTTPDIPVTPETPNQPGVPTTPVPPIVPIVRTDPVVTPPAPLQPVQPVQPNPEAPLEPEVVVPDNETPQVKVDDNETPKAKSSASWALINLISSILTVLLVIVILLGKRNKEEEQEDETVTYKRRKWTMIASVVVALSSIIAFILTENILLPMIFVDKWTFLMVAILLVQVVVFVLAKKWKKNDNKEVQAQA